MAASRVRRDAAGFSLPEGSESICQLDEQGTGSRTVSLGGIYEVTSASSISVVMSRRGWEDGCNVPQAPGGLIEGQILVLVVGSRNSNKGVWSWPAGICPILGRS